MHVVFFGSRLPLTKTIAFRDGAFAVAPYPHVSKLTSYSETADSLASFHTRLIEHAAAAHCLFNGQLREPLVDASRAGKTLKGAPREWVVFDFDKVDAKSHEEVVGKYLPAECQNVSYIAQPSSSMYRPGTDQWSGHIFMLLKEASNEVALKGWFESLNFTNAALSESLSLTDSGIGLHWPLDRSAAYDSKLIYIAPPRTFGFEPAVSAADAFKLVKKKQPSLKIGAHRQVSKHEIDAKINELRKAAGLDELDFRTRPFEDGEVLVNAEPGTIADIKPMGDHYIKFNLNGGDSLGYWIDLRNPSVIKNFKGEPWLLTKDVDEKFYKKLAGVAGRVTAKPPLDEGTEVLAFYATNQNSKIKIGQYEGLSSKVTLNGATETSARAWLAEFGVIGGGYLPHMDLIFDPTRDEQYVSGATYLNTFSPTPYMKQTRSKDARSTLRDIPPTINKLLTSMLGNPTQDIYEHFIHWLAYILQTRRKSETSWVVTGRTGTGKGTFVKHVLRPLFGDSAVQNVQFSALAKEFNGWLENSLFVVFEECDTKAVDNTAELEAKLRHYITDSPIQIRRMNTDHYSAPNYSNFLFFANERTPVIVRGDNRRLNITERQEQQIFFTPNELLALQNQTELEQFADVLHRWPIDEFGVRRIISTQAALDMHEATTPISQQIADAVLAGDLEFFIDRMPSDIEASAAFMNRMNPIGTYRKQIDDYMTAAAKGQQLLLKDDELYVLWRTLVPDSHFFKDDKIWRRRHWKALGVDVDKINRVPGAWDKRARGVLVTWKRPASSPPPIEPKTNVIDIKKPTGRKKK